MKLVNILALTNAKLINEPFVNTFLNITYEAKKIKRGDLFIAYDETQIEEAVLNGAYGVMFDKPTQISDNEIAWIKVDDLDTALKKLLRFKLVEKDIISYSCNDIILKLALQVLTESTFVTIHGNIKEIFSDLWEIEPKSTILFCPNLCERDLFTDVKEIPQNDIESINIIEQTLFETSFIYDNTFYERQNISPFFIPYLEQLLNLYKTLNIAFRLKKFSAIDHFEPVFVNKNFELKEFGTSDKVLIFEPKSEMINSQIEFLHKKAPWAKVIYILPYDAVESDAEDIITYKNKNEIVDILKTKTFHFALIAGADKSILQKPIKVQPQLTLF
jgi:ferrochelatase